MDEVPDLRRIGDRFTNAVVSLVLGMLGAVVVAVVLPDSNSREGSAFAPLFLVIAMGVPLSLGLFALFDRGVRYRWRPELPTARARFTTSSRGSSSG
jgi:ABC-type arginine/histidine transport system permease subunit